MIHVFLFLKSTNDSNDIIIDVDGALIYEVFSECKQGADLICMRPPIAYLEVIRIAPYK